MSVETTAATAAAGPENGGSSRVCNTSAGNRGSSGPTTTTAPNGRTASTVWANNVDPSRGNWALGVPSSREERPPATTTVSKGSCTAGSGEVGTAQRVGAASSDSAPTARDFLGNPAMRSAHSTATSTNAM